MLRRTLKSTAELLLVTSDPDLPQRVESAFRGHRVQALVDDNAANLFIDQNCGPIIEWSYEPHADGQRQWLTIFDETKHRVVEGEIDTATELRAQLDLSERWPSIDETWRETTATERAPRQWSAYVDRLEWEDSPNPWG